MLIGVVQNGRTLTIVSFHKRGCCTYSDTPTGDRSSFELDRPLTGSPCARLIARRRMRVVTTQDHTAPPTARRERSAYLPRLNGERISRGI